MEKTSDTFARLDSDAEKGLPSSKILDLQKKYGRNELENKHKISLWKLLFSQFKDVLIVVLIVAAMVSLGLSFVEEHSSPTEGVLIIAIVIAIAIVGFLNEYKAEKTVEALRKLVGQTAKVRRDGKEIEVSASELVPGDILLLEEGQKVPADARIFLCRDISVDEASLTGESVPVSKNTNAIASKVSLGDQKNMIFSGTIIATGTGEAIVTSTGNTSEIGKIAEMVSAVEEELTPMQKKLDDLGKQLGVGILAISAVVFIIILFFNQDTADFELIQRLVIAFTAAVALAVAAIPEGLAFVVRISLALGARRMAAKDALVRKLSAVEALGSTDVICSDKTGTLTRGQMTVREIWFGQSLYEVSGAGYETTGKFSSGDRPNPDKDLSLILKIGALCNNSKIGGEKGIIGDPTEGSLLVSAAKAGHDSEALKTKFPRIDELPFSSSRRMMTTIHEDGKKYLIATKGAPETVLQNCTHIMIDGKKVALTDTQRNAILQATSEMASKALRVLGFAFQMIDTKPDRKKVEQELVFLGLQGMMDPPRDEVIEVIHRIQSEAGMRVIMITGDYVETAKAIAREIGILGESISGVELDEMSQEEFEKQVEHIDVYARVNPEHKIRIVQALKKHGHQVAMTGDGVNDAPAIKAADIGIAMGINGTDAAKEAADLILLDDQFLTIIDAVEEGRGIFDNVRKFVNYLLSANIAEVLVILFGVILLDHLVLTAVQLLFINIVTDGLPAVALGSDPAERNIMRFKPFHFQGTIITKRIWVEMFIFGALMTILLLVHFAFVEEQLGFQAAEAVAFTSMVVYEMVRLIGIRSDYKIKWFSNPWLSVAIAASFAILMAVLYFEPLARLFEVAPIRMVDWGFIALGSIVLLVVMKFVKKIIETMMPEVAPRP